MEKPKQPFLPLDRQPVLSLITPSASPPASRSTSHARDGQPSPAKRPRLNFTPSTVSSPSPSVRAQSQSEAPKFDFEAARHESTMRVLNVWSQLAERYTRRLDEDDIIDLRSGNVIKDRGVLRKAQAEYRFGYITQDDGPSNDASSDGGAITEGEDDLDEVDALVADEGISAELNAELERVKHKGFDAADQDDLREFLEAEKRIQDGHEVDEDYSDDEIGDLSTIMRGEEEEEAEKQVLAPERDDAESGGTDWEELPDGVDGGAAISSGEESEDELGAWEPDESNAVYAVSTELSDTEPPTGPPFSFSDHNEEIEISDTPPSSPSPGRTQSTSAVHSTLPVRATPDTAKSRPLKRRRSPSVAVQLQTPPRSFSSYTDDSEVPLADLSPTIPSRLSSLSRFDSGASAVFPATSARNTSSSAIAGGSRASGSSSLHKEESASGKKPKSVKKKASRRP
ncbi:hypothetical protein EWM64_g9029 [Hericium alpestre]|uniref:Uncharacterized protein n=1 Tax=Hericium alpestre TaxID=135208 RepID=A0A4Y9ZLY7_9AGAM|nr:hypothetical protein EWM64_g9029 [Hericium alpestre]